MYKDINQSSKSRARYIALYKLPKAHSPMLFGVAFTLILSSFSALSSTATICGNCGTQEAAAKFAKKFANKLQCSSTFDSNYQCVSKNKIVTVVDKKTAKPYRFNIYHEKNIPWNVKADVKSIPSNEKFLLSNLARFFKAYSDAISQTSTLNLLPSSSISNFRLADESNSELMTTSSNTCPSNTALGALTDPNKLDEIRRVASMEIGAKLLSKANEYNVANLTNHYSINSAVTGSYKGYSATLNGAKNVRIPAWTKSFDVSERASSRKDFFAYKANLIAYDGQGLPVIEFTMSDSSQIAGYTLGALKGKNGFLKIENECIEAKFEEAVNQGIFTMKKTSIGSEGGVFGPPSDGSEHSGSGGGAIFPSCEIIDFYQGGRRIYTFRRC